MEYLYDLLFYFMIYSFAGWCGEVVFATVRHGKFVNRGMLHGAYCPIYGFGLIIVIVCLTPIKDSWLLLFVGSALLTTVLEFVTGFVGLQQQEAQHRRIHLPAVYRCVGACQPCYNEGHSACCGICRGTYLEAARHSHSLPFLCGNTHGRYTDIPRGKEAQE